LGISASSSTNKKRKKGKSSLVEFCRKKREAFFVSQMDLRWNLDKDGMKKN
jgi:hypothetical protein